MGKMRVYHNVHKNEEERPNQPLRPDMTKARLGAEKVKERRY